MHTLLQPGDQVWIRQSRWTVERAHRDGPVTRLDVAGGGVRQVFLAPFDRIRQTTAGRTARRVRPQEALARTAALVARAGRARLPLAAAAANIEILAHQLEPLIAVRRGARRLLIADDVGLGKTIQAGLILADELERLPGCRALVIVPASLQRQWRAELQCRFRIDAALIEPATIARLSRAMPRRDGFWRRAGVGIASLDFLKQPHVRDGCLSVAWDAVIVDEAHGACGDSERHEMIQAVGRRARCLVLLSATPHSGDGARFARLMSSGALPCRADDVVVFRRRRRRIRDSRLSARWCRVRVSTAERRVLDLLLEFEGAVLNAATSDRRAAALLLLSVFRKRAVSTSRALAISLERRLALIEEQTTIAEPWRQQPLAFDDGAAGDDAALGARIDLDPAQERSWARRLLEHARKAARVESKVARLARLIARAAEPVIVFTEYRDSALAVEARLRSTHAVGIIHGGLPAPVQHEEVRRFLDAEVSVIVATDVAGQGLNLQARGRWVVNFDLPWSPAVLEQRAGRVDRIGQRHPVHVTSFVVRHEAQSVILTRLARRMLAARQALGADSLDALPPNEERIRASVIAHEPVQGPEAEPRLETCTRWSRLAVAMVAELRWRRVFSNRWRGGTASASAGRAPINRLPHVRSLAGDHDLHIVTVPLVNARAEVVDREVVGVRAPAMPSGQQAPAALDAVLSVARRKAERAARRATRAATARGALERQREDAIAGVMREALAPGESQPGLFDRRQARADASAASALEEIDLDWAARCRAIQDRARIETGPSAVAVVFEIR